MMSQGDEYDEDHQRQLLHQQQLQAQLYAQQQQAQFAEQQQQWQYQQQQAQQQAQAQAALPSVPALPEPVDNNEQAPPPVDAAAGQDKPAEPAPKKKRGRPKGSKNKNTGKSTVRGRKRAAIIAAVAGGERPPSPSSVQKKKEGGRTVTVPEGGKSIEEVREQEKHWMEMWKDAQKELRQLRQDMKEEPDEEIRAEIAEDIEGLKRRKGDWARLIGLKSGSGGLGVGGGAEFSVNL